MSRASFRRAAPAAPAGRARHARPSHRRASSIISSVASGDVGPYVGPADITMMYSVTDVQGLNSISRSVLANGANAIAGMVEARAWGQSGQARTQRAGRSAGHRHHHVRRDDAGRAEDRGRPAQRFRMSRLPRHRRRRPIDGKAGRFRHARRRHRFSDDGSLRSPDGRRVSRHRRPLRR